MIKLLQVELKKIFKRKSIYIIWSLMLLFCLLNNILYLTDYDTEGNYKFIEQENLEAEETKLKEELKKYSYLNSNEVTMYVTIKTKLDIVKLKNNFSPNSWQYNKINDYLYDILYQLNYDKYATQTNEQQNEKDYQNLIEKLKNDDYQYFLKIEIQNCIDIISGLKQKYIDTENEKDKQELEKQIIENEFNLKILNYRLQNNIKENNNYLNNALENYIKNYQKIKYYNEYRKTMTYQEKIEYQDAIYDTKISQFILNNKKNINKQNNLNYQLRTIIEDYEIFIVILTLIICSTIICDEFKDGTIKLLLIKPYSRGKILLSKYFTSIIVIAFSVILLIMMQFVIGGIIFGFESLKIPVVVYDFTNTKLIEYPVIQYMLIRIIAKIPFILALIIISFLLGVLTSNSIITITMPLILYMFTPTMKYLTLQNNLEFMKYMININWDIQEYLFGKLPQISFVNLQFSLTILVIYFIIMLMVTYIVFQKKNIKNI